MNEFIAKAKEIESEIIIWRRNFHENPELGLELPQTSKYVKERLKEMGYDPIDCGPSGIYADLKSKKGGKTILLRADMDALAINEEAEIDCKSKNDNMHACGHDFHTAMLLGAAKILKQYEETLEGNVRFMFQPGEELLIGAKTMIEHGILENPKPDAAVMFHVAVGIKAPAGILIVPNPGAFSSASDRFEILVKGKGGHGAMPESAIDPLVVSAHILLALQTIRSREVSGGENCVLTVGVLEGGRANNVIPDTAVMKGTLRTFNGEVRKSIHKRIKEIAEGVASSMRAEAIVDLIEGCPSVLIDKKVADDVKEVLIDTFGERAVPNIESLGMSKMGGSEDFSFVSEQVPSVMLSLTAGGVEEKYSYPMHHPKACFNESVLAQGAAAYAAIAAGWLDKNK